MTTIKDAKEATEAIVKKLRHLSVILFGSVARKGTGADLDLLIITDDRAGAGGNAEMLLHKCLKRFYRRFAIDPFVVSMSSLKKHYYKGSPFLRLIWREGRVLYMKHAVKQWIQQSEDELNTARYLLEGGFFKSACYHARQAIEKSIKAALLNKGWDLEKIHNTERLVAIGKEYRIKIGLSSDEEIIFIDSIYRGRYPAEAGLLPLGEPSKADAAKAARIAGRIYKEMRKACGGGRGNES